jgi:DNA-binding IclR family transcriptional regulator
MGMARSTTYDYLNTLNELNYLSKEDGEYVVGLRFLEHGANARKNFIVYKHCQPTLNQLAEDTEEAAWIVVEQQNKGVYLENSLGDRAVQTHAYVGKRSQLYHLASGKAILSQYPPERVRTILHNEGIKDEIDSISDFFKELRNTQRNKYALNENAFIKGVRSVSTPIVADEKVEGAISVSGPANRLSGQVLDEIIDELLSAANEIELRIVQEV